MLLLQLLSLKTRATANSLGLSLPLIAPIRGFGNRLWGRDFIKVAEDVGRPLETIASGQSMLYAPDPTGSWTDRPVNTSEVSRWLSQILSKGDFAVQDGLSAHSAKATLLSMMSKYGASPEHRLILGHRSMRSYGTLEVYSRDLQAAPLRALEKMKSDVRKGLFCPDKTASGIVFPDSGQDGP